MIFFYSRIAPFYFDLSSRVPKLREVVQFRDFVGTQERLSSDHKYLRLRDLCKELAFGNQCAGE
jgi:hypothetical protein